MKKTKFMTKVMAVVFALAILFAMSVPAFAAENMTGENGVIGEFNNDNPSAVNHTLTLYKEITALNPETCTVNAPTITYSYTVSPGEAGKTITDASSHHAQINNTDVNVSVTTKAGVGSPTVTGTTASNSTTGNGVLAFTPADQLNASEYGTANRFPIDIDFSAINYSTTGSGAGVYRYVISEACSTATKNAAGISEGSVANTLYVDVYVDSTGAIYGYVLFNNNVNIDASPDADSTAATTAGKTEGFVGSEPDDAVYTSDSSVADKYYTFNFDVSKTVVNDTYAIDNSHQFPFSVTFANANVSANVLPKVTNTGSATFTAPTTAGAIASFSYDGTAATVTNNLTIAHNAVVSFVGIPCGTTVTINEKNDVTGVTYSSVSTNADTNAAAKSINTGDVSNNAIITNTTHITRATANHTGNGKVTFTNTLLEISPTGIAYRVAPYVLMLAAGVSLIVLFAKRRREITDMI